MVGIKEAAYGKEEKKLVTNESGNLQKEVDAMLSLLHSPATFIPLFGKVGVFCVIALVAVVVFCRRSLTLPEDFTEEEFCLHSKTFLKIYITVNNR